MPVYLQYIVWIAVGITSLGVILGVPVSSLRDDKAQELALAIDRLRVKVEAGTATGLRMEQRAIGIADDLIVATGKVEGVERDLAASHKRADETHHTAAPGAAADAAAQQTAKEKRQADAEDNSDEPVP